jgi:hypothetical protein
VEWQLLEQDFLAGCSYDEEINPILLTAQLKEIMDIFGVKTVILT